MMHGQTQIKIILDFKLSPCVECCIFLLGNSPASEFSVPTFRNTLIHLHRPFKQEEYN